MISPATKLKVFFVYRHETARRSLAARRRAEKEAHESGAGWCETAFTFLPARYLLLGSDCRPGPRRAQAGIRKAAGQRLSYYSDNLGDLGDLDKYDLDSVRFKSTQTLAK